MVVGFAGLEDVTSSLSVTPVVCVYQPTNLTNVSPILLTTIALSAWRTSTPAGWRPTSHLVPTFCT